MELSLKDVLKGACIVIIGIIILYLTYQLSFLIAKNMGIENEIIPAISIAVPDMRGDIKIFTGLAGIIFFIAMGIYSNYCDKIEENNRKNKNYNNSANNQTKKQSLIQQYELYYDRNYPPTNQINVEGKRIAKILIDKNNHGGINLSLCEAVYSKMDPKYKKDEHFVLMRVVDYFSAMHYDIINTSNLTLTKWD